MWLTMYAALSTYQLGLNAGFPPLYSVPEFPYEPDVYPPESPAPSEIKWYNPMHLSQLMRFSSTLPTAWLAGIHGLSLCLYLQMCKAIAECVLPTCFCINSVTNAVLYNLAEMTRRR